MDKSFSTKDKQNLRLFVFRRLGNPKGPISAVRKMFRLSFGAKSFADFWRYWNPVHHYFLSYYVYKPLRRIMPRSMAVILTFVFCGFFLHDIVHIAFTGIPLIAVWFFMLAIGVLIGEYFNMNMSSRSDIFRVIVNLGYLLVSFEIARRLALMVFSGG
jgi:hypothetical protein